MRGRRLVRWTAIAAAGLVLLLILLVLLVPRTDWAAERARYELVTRVSEALDAELQVDELSGSLLSNVRLGGVRIVRAGEVVVAVDRAVVRYDAWRLWRTGLHFDAVELDGATLALVEDADGWNIAKLVRARPPDAPPRDPVDFTIDALQLRTSTVSVQPHDGQRRVLEAVNLVGALDFVDGALDIDIDSATMRDPDTGVDLTGLEGSLSFGDGRMALDDLQVSTGASRVSGRAAFETDAVLATLEADLETAPLAIRELTPYVPALERLPQSALLDASIGGTGGDLSATWTVRSDAGGGTGTWAGRLDGEAIPIVGRAETRAFNLAAWTGVPDLESAIDAAVTFNGAVPVGDPEAIDVRFTVAAPRLDLLGYQATGVKADGRYAAGRLEASGSAAAYGATASADVTWTRDGAFALDGTFSDVDLSRLPERLRVPPLSTSLAGTGAVAFDEAGWHGSATLAASTVEGAAIAEGAIASFDTRGDALRYAFTGDLADLDPSRLVALGEPAATRLREYPGAINGRLTVNASGTTLASLDGTASADLRDTIVAGVSLQTARIDARMAGGALDATVDAAVRDLTEQVLPGDPGVTFRTSGTISGTVRLADTSEPVDAADVDADVLIRLGPTRIRETALDSVDLTATLADGVATITRLAARGDGLTADATGTVVVDGARESDLTFSATVADLGLLDPYVDDPIEGRVTLDGRLTGPPQNARVNGTYSALDVQAAGVSVVEARGSLDVLIPDYDPARATGLVATEASLIEAGGVSLTTATGTVRLENGRYLVSAELADQLRTVTAEAAVTPHEEGADIALSALSLTANGMTWRLADGPPAAIEYRGERVGVTGLTLALGAGRVHVAGVFGDPATSTPLTARLDGVRLEDFAGLMPEDQRLTGPLAGTITVAGPRDAPSVSANIRVDGGTINDLAFESFAGTVRMDGPGLETNVVLEAGPLGRFEAIGTVPSPFAGDDAPAAEYDLVVRSSDISLGFLQPLTTAATGIAGSGRFDVTVRGPAEEPVLDGTVTLTGGAFTLVASGVSYQNVAADLEVRGQQVVVQHFELADEDGHRATVQGELNLPGIGPPTGFELYVTASELHVLENAYGEVATSVNLTVMGDLQTPLISGTIRVDRGVIEASDLLDRLSARGYRRAPLAEGENLEAGPVDRSSVSVTLELPDNVVVRGRDLRSGSGPLGLGDINATIGGALSISKETAERPLVTGNVRVIRGTYQFQGRRFEIQRDSEIIFNGSPTNPSLNVDATREISGVVANVHLGGTLERPDLVLTSDPPLDQGDVLSLIVFNQAMNALPTEQRVSLAARAGVLAAGAIASPLSDSVRRALDLDTFEIRPDESASGASVIIGRQLNDRVFVGFRQTFGASEASQLSFEYRVSELLRIVTSLEQGPEGRSLRSRRTEAAGIDLIFVIR